MYTTDFIGLEVFYNCNLMKQALVRANACFIWTNDF
ncbi:predicted protein [Listeria monocytogenes J2818]|nr:predicted protein [Listeria monocytogenes J2818]